MVAILEKATATTRLEADAAELHGALSELVARAAAERSGVGAVAGCCPPSGRK
jgi:hypothetical protein